MQAGTCIVAAGGRNKRVDKQGGEGDCLGGSAQVTVAQQGQQSDCVLTTRQSSRGGGLPFEEEG